jgi:hypothetical protein
MHLLQGNQQEDLKSAAEIMGNLFSGSDKISIQVAEILPYPYTTIIERIIKPF